MVVTRTTSSSSGVSWIHYAGTIQEVLDALSADSMSALNTPYWSDDGTDAKAIACKQE